MSRLKFQFNTVVGKGGFGKVAFCNQVWKCIYRVDGGTYAIKKMSKLK